MADTKISALPAAGSASSTDELPVNQSGTTRKATLAQVSAAIGSLGAGKIVQTVVSESSAYVSGSTAIPMDSTIPQNTEGDQYLSVTITPTSATNRLKIEVNVFFTANGASWVVAAVFQDSVVNALKAFAAYQNINGGSAIPSFWFTMVAGTTSATTFKLRCGPDVTRAIYFNGSSSAGFFGGVMGSGLKVTEYIP